MPTTGPIAYQDPAPTLLETLIRLGTPYLPAVPANEEIIRLTVENIRLQAQIDEMRAR